MAERRLWFRHQCIVCKMLFVSERDLVLHEATHDKSNFVCSLCSEVFETADEYKFHASVGCESNSSSVQVCADCGAVFEQARDLYDHHSAVHLNEQKFQCRFCSAKFSWLKNLAKHERMHQTNSSMCRTCGAIFASMASLKVHLWKAHSVNIQEQDGHMIKMHIACKSSNQECKTIGTAPKLCVGCQSLKPKDVTSRQDNEKPYKCSLCNWAFKYDFSYAMHMKTHKEKLKRAESQAIVDINFKDLNENSGFTNNKYDTPVQTFTNAKKTIIIKRTDIPNKILLALSKSPVTVSKKACESTSSTISPIKSYGCKEQAVVINNINIREQSQSNLLTHKTQKPHQRPSSSSSVFTCKTCMVTFQYDFSYVAHMNYHKKVQQLNGKIDKDPCYVSDCYDGNAHGALLTKNKLSACEILLNSDAAIVNSDGSVLIKVDDVIQQNLMDSLYNFANDKMAVACPTKGLYKSATYPAVIHSVKDLLGSKSCAISGTGRITEEVINSDNRNSSVLEVSYLPEESKLCNRQKFKNDSSDMELGMVVDNQDNLLLNSVLQITSDQVELDGIVDVAIDDISEPDLLSKAESMEGTCYDVLIDESFPSVNNASCGLHNGTKEKMHRCAFCRAEFRWKTSLSNHMRRHIKGPKKIISNLQPFKVRKAVIRP